MGGGMLTFLELVKMGGCYTIDAGAMYMYNCMLPYQLYVGPLNSEAGQTGGMRAVRKETRKARRVLPDLGFDKIDKNQTQLRYFEISINKIPARRYVKNFQVGQ